MMMVASDVREFDYRVFISVNLILISTITISINSMRFF